MEENAPAPSKGYQKKIKVVEEQPVQPAKPKGNYAPSTTAQKWPALVEAIEAGNVEVVKQLIEEGVNVNLSRNGITPLMHASSKGKTEIAEVILQAGVNINATDDEGWTALHKAAVDQDGTAIIELLMQSGIDVEAQNKSKKTALQLAEEAKHRAIVQLINKGKEKREADIREWEAFLNSPEGLPYKQQKLHATLTSISKFIWLPPVALGAAGIGIGTIIHAAILSGMVGAALGLLASLVGYVLLWKVGSYLDGLEPLPHLDITIVREKHKAGEKITVSKKSRKAFAAEPESEPAASAQNVRPVAANTEPMTDPAPDDEPALAKKPSFLTGLNLPGINVRTFSAAGALVLLLIIGLLFMYRGPLTNWYYTKKIERAGLAFTSQAFLTEVSKNHEDAVDLFIKAGMPIDAKNDKGQTALMIAVEKGHVKILGKLAALNTELLTRTDAGGNTALMDAARLGQEQSVITLLEKGADVNYLVPAREGAATALQAALDVQDFTAAHMNVIIYLLQHGANVKGKNAAGRFPLLFAIEKGRKEAAAFLIEKGADVNDTDLQGNFPLLHAAGKGDMGLLTLLADKGANMKMASADGQTPLICAVREGHEDAVKLLLERGATVNAGAKDGSTALTAAARNGNAALAKLLLEKGADPSSGYLPDPFVHLNGKEFTIRTKKSKLSDVLKLIAKTASRDGYTITLPPALEQTLGLQLKEPWNKVLVDLAAKNHLLLIVKDTTVFVLPYDPASVKRG